MPVLRLLRQSKEAHAWLYVRKGEGIPFLTDADQWTLEGTVRQSCFSPDVWDGIKADGHAFQELGK